MKKITILLSAILIIALVVFSSVCAFAASNGQAYVYDEARILSNSEVSALELKAQSIAENYSCSVYVVTVDNMKSYGYSDAYNMAVDVYKTNDLGYGAAKNGLILLLSMAERDYGLATYGTLGNAAFNNSQMDRLEDAFLDNFRSNDWYGGFRDYLNTADKALNQYYNPPSTLELVAEAYSEYGVFAAIAALVVGGIRILLLSAKMKSVAPARTAGKYVGSHGLVLKGHRDVYTHTTTTRVKIQSSSSSGGSHGSHHSGGGFSGRSGKF